MVTAAWLLGLGTTTEPKELIVLLEAEKQAACGAVDSHAGPDAELASCHWRWELVRLLSIEALARGSAAPVMSVCALLVSDPVGIRTEGSAQRSGSPRALAPSPAIPRECIQPPGP